MSDLDPYWAHADYSIYMGRKLYLKKPHNPSPRLLGLACKAPVRHLQVTYNTSTTLHFDLLCYTVKYKVLLSTGNWARYINKETIVKLLYPI